MNREEVDARSGLFVALLLIVNAVEDGLPKFSSPLRVQLATIPITLLFLWMLGRFLFRPAPSSSNSTSVFAHMGDARAELWLVLLLAASFIPLFWYETFHFVSFGYNLVRLPTLIAFAAVMIGLAWVSISSTKVRASAALGIFLASYASVQMLSILSFPLNYLRSDMLPVILYANRALLAGRNPYHSFFIEGRLYDFPYLPGMILAFTPAQALHLDLRWAAICYVGGGMGLVFWAAAREFRLRVAALIGLFVLCPYLQYRHDLYTQGHFFSLIVVFVLMQRRRFAWSAVAFGISMVISQFSWVIFPFFLMNGLRRGGWREVGRMAGFAAAAAGVVMAPFLVAGVGSIAHNAVGQWDNMVRPIARPMNLSFWATYVVRPSHLKWVQLAILSGIFCWCWWKGRCADLADTLRWMIAALTIFILFNVLIDGYFYLMLLVPMLVYTCVANGWWRNPPEPIQALDL